MSEPKSEGAPKDIAILRGPTEDGKGAQVVRIRDGEVSAGEIRPVKEGESIGHSELVRLRPLDPQQRVCAVEVLHAPPQRASESRPARVSNAKYRANWSAIFERERGTTQGDSDWSLN